MLISGVFFVNPKYCKHKRNAADLYGTADRDATPRFLNSAAISSICSTLVNNQQWQQKEFHHTNFIHTLHLIYNSNQFNKISQTPQQCTIIVFLGQNGYHCCNVSISLFLQVRYPLTIGLNIGFYATLQLYHVHHALRNKILWNFSFLKH